MTAPEYLVLKPGELADYGDAATAVLDMYVYELIRFRCSAESRVGTYERDGVVWWRASIPDLCTDLGGVREHTARSSLDRLSDLGKLVREKHSEQGIYDRTWSYRPEARKSADRSAEKRASSSAEKRASSSLPKEGKNSESDELFEAWWKVYPRKTAKANARKSYAKALKLVDADVLLVATEKFAADVKAKGTEERFVPHGATWLNGERWSEFGEEQLTGAVDDRVRELMADERYDELARLAGVEYVVPDVIQDLPPGAEKSARREEFRRDWRIRFQNEIRAGVASALAS